MILGTIGHFSGSTSYVSLNWALRRLSAMAHVQILTQDEGTTVSDWPIRGLYDEVTPFISRMPQEAEYNIYDWFRYFEGEFHDRHRFSRTPGRAPAPRLNFGVSRVQRRRHKRKAFIHSLRRN